MNQIVIFSIMIFSLSGLLIQPVMGYTASKFAADYGNDLSQGQKIQVLVKVKGTPEYTDPAKRAKEIRNIQYGVLKFCNFAGAVNVKSDMWKNQFTADVTTSLAEVIQQRNDVKSVHIFKEAYQLPQKIQEGLNEYDVIILPLWIQNTINWQIDGNISEDELVNAINYVLE